METETAYMEFYDYRDQVAMQAGANTGFSGQTALVLQNGVDGSKSRTLETKIIPVQFQPSSLRFQSSSRTKEGSRGDISKPEDTRRRKPENAEPAAPERLTMSLSLIFDHTLHEEGNVMTRVEGLLAAVRSPFTRQVSFNWGELYYKGRVTEIEAEYEMFGQDGSPVRARVDLTIAMSDTSVRPESGLR